MPKPQKKHITPAFQDDRGKITDIMTEPVHHVGIVTFKKGSIRGRHFHKESAQMNYVLKGKVQLTMKDMTEEQSTPETIILEEGDIITMPENWYHEFIGLEEESSILFSTTGGRHDSAAYEADTYRIDKL